MSRSGAGKQQTQLDQQQFIISAAKECGGGGGGWAEATKEYLRKNPKSYQIK